MSYPKKYIIAIDQSTSASKVILFNQNAELVHRISIAHQQFYPHSGFVEHDAMEIFNNVISGIKSLISATKISESEIAGIGITNAQVRGQALPGVPVITTVNPPGMNYIIFPGNVGNEYSLLDLYKKLRTS